MHSPGNPTQPPTSTIHIACLHTKEDPWSTISSRGQIPCDVNLAPSRSHSDRALVRFHVSTLQKAHQYLYTRRNPFSLDPESVTPSQDVKISRLVWKLPAWCIFRVNFWCFSFRVLYSSKKRPIKWSIVWQRTLQRHQVLLWGAATMNLINSYQNFNSPHPIYLIPQKKLWLETPIWILAVFFFQIKIFHFPQGNIQSSGQFCRWKPALWQVKKVAEKKNDQSSIEISFFIWKSAIC